MNRVSTVGNYSSILANLMAAQQRQIEAGNQVSTEKKGSSLKDYAHSAEMLTAMRAVDTRAAGYLEQNTLIADKLTQQDSALNQVADAAKGAREAIAEALASGRVDTLMQDLQAQMNNAVEGMNARYGGKYLFAGGQIDTQPVQASKMSQLTNPATVVFHNDQFVVQAKLDDSTTVDTGILADQIGQGLMTRLKQVQTYHEGNMGPLSGPFTGQMTDDQRTFLEGELKQWDTVYQNIVDVTGQNGLVQKRVDSVKDDVVSRQSALKGMIGDITDVDMAEAISRLQQAQMSVQAAAQVFSTLQQSSLLNILRS